MRSNQLSYAPMNDFIIAVGDRSGKSALCASRLCGAGLVLTCVHDVGWGRGEGATGDVGVGTLSTGVAAG